MRSVEFVHQRAAFGRRVEVLAYHLAALLPPNARVLDVGCGDGSVAEAVMQLRRDLEVSGLDVLVRPATRIAVEPFDGETIPFVADSFDAIMLVDVLHHTHDQLHLLREAARVARHSIVIKDHLADGLLARQRLRVMDWFGNAHHGVALTYRYWSRREWEQAFARLGTPVDVWITKLPLYPAPISLAFGRGLHVVCRLAVERREHAGTG